MQHDGLHVAACKNVLLRRVDQRVHDAYSFGILAAPPPRDSSLAHSTYCLAKPCVPSGREDHRARVLTGPYSKTALDD
jgi:hypothetical protein